MHICLPVFLGLIYKEHWIHVHTMERHQQSDDCLNSDTQHATRPDIHMILLCTNKDVGPTATKSVLVTHNIALPCSVLSPCKLSMRLCAAQSVHQAGECLQQRKTDGRWYRYVSLLEVRIIEPGCRAWHIFTASVATTLVTHKLYQQIAHQSSNKRHRLLSQNAGSNCRVHQYLQLPIYSITNIFQ